MLALANEAQERKADLGDLLAREEGKTLPEAIGEVTRAGNIFKFFAGEALRIPGEVVPSVCPGIGVEFTREPVGVVSIITPWNFPIAIPAWKIAPALYCGNAVVFKLPYLQRKCVSCSHLSRFASAAVGLLVEMLVSGLIGGCVVQAWRQTGKTRHGNR